MIQKIIEDVAEQFNVDPIDIVHPHGKTGRDISTSRYVCAFLLKNKLPMDKIAALLGRRNDQYGYAAVKRVETRSLEDHSFYMKVLKLSERFGVGFSELS